MRTVVWPVALVAVLAVSAPAALAGKRLKLVADGSLAAAQAGGPQQGTFAFSSVLRSSGDLAQSAEFRASGLDATLDAQGRLPTYHVVLASPDRTMEVDLGSLHLQRTGAAKYRRKGETGLPTSVRAFEGWSAEIRRDGTVILQGVIPTFAIDGSGRWVTRNVIAGDFEGVDRPRANAGSFLLRSKSRDGVRRERISVVSPRIDTKPVNGTEPVYTSRLINEARSLFTEIGRLTNETSLGASLHLDSARAPLPGGITNLGTYSGGTVEIRQGSTVRLRGPIEPFRDIGAPFAASGSAFARGVEGLLPTDVTNDARGLAEARIRVNESGRREQLRIHVQGREAGETFSIVAFAADGSSTTLGSLQIAGKQGTGTFRLNTRRGAGIPGGTLARYSRQPLELRDAEGDVVMSGLFPRLE